MFWTPKYEKMCLDAYNYKKEELSMPVTVEQATPKPPPIESITVRQDYGYNNEPLIEIAPSNVYPGAIWIGGGHILLDSAKALHAALGRLIEQVEV